jgi:hypothetical protein
MVYRWHRAIVEQRAQPQHPITCDLWSVTALPFTNDRLLLQETVMALSHDDPPTALSENLSN